MRNPSFQDLLQALSNMIDRTRRINESRNQLITPLGATGTEVNEILASNEAANDVTDGAERLLNSLRNAESLTDEDARRVARSLGNLIKAQSEANKQFRALVEKSGIDRTGEDGLLQRSVTVNGEQRTFGSVVNEFEGIGQQARGVHEAVTQLIEEGSFEVPADPSNITIPIPATATFTPSGQQDPDESGEEETVPEDTEDGEAEQDSDTGEGDTTEDAGDGSGGGGEGGEGTDDSGQADEGSQENDRNSRGVVNNVLSSDRDSLTRRDLIVVLNRLKGKVSAEAHDGARALRQFVGEGPARITENDYEVFVREGREARGLVSRVNAYLDDIGVRTEDGVSFNDFRGGELNREQVRQAIDLINELQNQSAELSSTYTQVRSIAGYIDEKDPAFRSGDRDGIPLGLDEVLPTRESFRGVSRAADIVEAEFNQRLSSSGNIDDPAPEGAEEVAPGERGGNSGEGDTTEDAGDGSGGGGEGGEGTDDSGQADEGSQENDRNSRGVVNNVLSSDRDSLQRRDLIVVLNRLNNKVRYEARTGASILNAHENNVNQNLLEDFRVERQQANESLQAVNRYLRNIGAMNEDGEFNIANMNRLTADQVQRAVNLIDDLQEHSRDINTTFTAAADSVPPFRLEGNPGSEVFEAEDGVYHLRTELQLPRRFEGVQEASRIVEAEFSERQSNTGNIDNPAPEGAEEVSVDRGDAGDGTDNGGDGGPDGGTGDGPDGNGGNPDHEPDVHKTSRLDRLVARTGADGDAASFDRRDLLTALDILQNTSGQNARRGLATLDEIASINNRLRPQALADYRSELAGLRATSNEVNRLFENLGLTSSDNGVVSLEGFDPSTMSEAQVRRAQDLLGQIQGHNRRLSTEFNEFLETKGLNLPPDAPQYGYQYPSGQQGLNNTVNQIETEEIEVDIPNQPTGGGSDSGSADTPPVDGQDPIGTELEVTPTRIERFLARTQAGTEQASFDRRDLLAALDILQNTSNNNARDGLEKLKTIRAHNSGRLNPSDLAGYRAAQEQLGTTSASVNRLFENLGLQSKDGIVDLNNFDPSTMSDAQVQRAQNLLGQLQTDNRQLRTAFNEVAQQPRLRMPDSLSDLNYPSVQGTGLNAAVNEIESAEIAESIERGPIVAPPVPEPSTPTGMPVEEPATTPEPIIDPAPTGEYGGQEATTPPPPVVEATPEQIINAPRELIARVQAKADDGGLDDINKRDLVNTLGAFSDKTRIHNGAREQVLSKIGARDVVFGQFQQERASLMSTVREVNTFMQSIGAQPSGNGTWQFDPKSLTKAQQDRANDLLGQLIQKNEGLSTRFGTIVDRVQERKDGTAGIEDRIQAIPVNIGGGQEVRFGTINQQYAGIGGVARNVHSSFTEKLAAFNANRAVENPLLHDFDGNGVESNHENILGNFFDTNRDGTITEREFYAGYDKNNDGNITVRERSTTNETIGLPVAFDANGNINLP